jgi:hypothetical protein
LLLHTHHATRTTGIADRMSKEIASLAPSAMKIKVSHLMT